MKYRATIREIATGRELIVFPRTRKTTFFKSVKKATDALDARGRRLSDGWSGRVYEVDADNERSLVYTMAL